jgi:hypothetical protein
MLRLWLLLDAIVFIVTVGAYLWLTRRSPDNHQRFQLLARILAIYTVMAVFGHFLLYYFESGYTFIGAIVYGIMLGGLHALLMAAVLLVIATAHK